MPDNATQAAAQQQLETANKEKSDALKKIEALIDETSKKYGVPKGEAMKFIDKNLPGWSAQIKQYDQKIKGLEDKIKQYTKLTDLYSPVIKAVQGDVAGAGVDIISQYAVKYAQYERKFFDVTSPRFVVYTAGVVSVGATFGASLNASLKTTANDAKTKVTSVGSITGKATMAVDVTVGFDTPIGNASLAGGVRGAINLKGNVTVSLEGKGMALTGTISGGATLNVGAELFLKTPSFTHVVLDKEYTYPLGSIDLLVGTMPTYSASFDMSSGNFTATTSGKWSLTLHPYVDTKVKEAKAWLWQKVKDYSDYVNPVVIAKKGYHLAGEAVDAVEDGVGYVGNKLEDGATAVYDYIFD